MIRIKEEQSNDYTYYLSGEEDKIVRQFIELITSLKSDNVLPSKSVLKKVAEALSDSRVQYDPEYGDDKECDDCGHQYYRHFDSYADMEPVGCKYCRCETFKKPVLRIGHES